MTLLTRKISLGLFATCLFTVAIADNHGSKTLQPADVHKILSVGDIDVSPDGRWTAYTVGKTDIEGDKYKSDLYMVSSDGKTRIQLTHTEDSGESTPRFSPDGQYLAFLAAREDGKGDDDDDPKSKSQVWLLNRAGGEAERLTEMPGGVSDFSWSPDSSQLVLVSDDPEDEPGSEEGEDEPTHDTPDPIVIDRYQFKRDRVGYLGDRYQRLYLFSMKGREATLLTPGSFDSQSPSWAPDGKSIAFVSKREGDPDRHDNTEIFVMPAKAGAEAKQITNWEGPDFSPVFSPDGKSIAYLQGGPPKYSSYDPARLAVVSASGGDPRFPAKDLDRSVASPKWSKNGESIHFLLTDDRIRSVASVAASGGDISVLFPTRKNPGVTSEYALDDKGVVTVTEFGQRPAEIIRADDGSALSDYNSAFLDTIELASVEAYDATSADGTRVGAMLLKPPGFKKSQRYPLIALIHGGPVAQDGFDFDFMSQTFAARGYIVVNPNYRGSNGRGRDFSRAIYADWGNFEIQDIHAVVDKLVADGLVDSKRMGIGGWSYGGMSTNYAIATDTRFAAAVSGAGIANMLAGYATDQYITQYENEVGLPWESIDTYLKISYPFYKAGRIKTPTLYMCGELDFNVPLINSEQMYQALRSQNVPTQLVIYPGQYHSLGKPSYVEDRMHRMIEWYDRYLTKK